MLQGFLVFGFGAHDPGLSSPGASRPGSGSFNIFTRASLPVSVTCASVFGTRASLSALGLPALSLRSRSPSLALRSRSPALPLALALRSRSPALALRSRSPALALRSRSPIAVGRTSTYLLLTSSVTIDVVPRVKLKFFH